MTTWSTPLNLSQFTFGIIGSRLFKWIARDQPDVKKLVIPQKMLQPAPGLTLNSLQVFDPPRPGFFGGLPFALPCTVVPGRLCTYNRCVNFAEMPKQVGRIVAMRDFLTIMSTPPVIPRWHKGQMRSTILLSML